MEAGLYEIAICSRVPHCRDSVEWGEELEREAEEKVRANSAEPLPDEQCHLAEQEAGQRWDQFYHQHQNRSPVTMFSMCLCHSMW